MDKRKQEGYNPKKIGEKSEVRFISQCVLNDWVVLTPLGDSERYDIVLDRGKGFERVQIKTGNLKDGKISFPTSSKHYHTAKGQRDKNFRRCYDGEVEWFGVYCHDNDKCYLINSKDVGRSEFSMRVEPTQNNQTKNIRFAKDFEI